MSDRRLTPANGRVAAMHLKGIIAADSYSEGHVAAVAVPVAELCKAPRGARDRQLLLGAEVTVYEDRGGWSFVMSRADGYVGYLVSVALAQPDHLTHFVATPATHAYDTESFKSRDILALPFGAKVQVIDERHKFFETRHGFIPKKHLRPVDRPFTDPATIAQMHYGVPYLWGGNSTRGIDCSGLVQAAFVACGVLCPADSDMQETGLGQPIEEGAALRRGDLVFWKGHVGMMVDEATLIHANAHHMAVAYEPLADAVLRIKAQGDGDVTMRRRV